MPLVSDLVLEQFDRLAAAADARDSAVTRKVLAQLVLVQGRGDDVLDHIAELLDGGAYWADRARWLLDHLDIDETDRGTRIIAVKGEF